MTKALTKDELRLIKEEYQGMNMSECSILTKGKMENGDLYFTFISNAREYENWHGDCGWDRVVISTAWHTCNDCGVGLLLSTKPVLAPLCPNCGSEAII